MARRPHAKANDSESDESDSYDSGPESMGASGGYSTDSDDVDGRLAALKAEMADIPFEDIQKFRKENSLRKQMRQARELGAADGNSADSSDDSGSDGNTRGGKGKKKGAKGAGKRKNKNRPMEVSAKKPVSRFRQVIEPTRKKSIDPRFASLSGKLDMEGFDNAYSFLDDYVEDEISTLKKELKKTKDADRKAEIQRVLTRKLQEITKKQKAVTRRSTMQKFRKEQREAVTKGKNPFYLKKSAIRTIEAYDKYKGLKSKGQVKQVIAKQRKKTAAKQHRYMPYQRANKD